MNFFNYIEPIRDVEIPGKLIRCVNLVAEKFALLNIPGDIYFMNGEEDGELGYVLLFHNNGITYKCIQHVKRSNDFVFYGLVLENELKSKLLSYQNATDVLLFSFVEQKEIDRIRQQPSNPDLEDDIHFDQCFNSCRHCGGLSELLIEISNNYTFIKALTHINDNADRDMQTEITVKINIDNQSGDDEQNDVNSTDPVDDSKKIVPVF